MNENLRTAAIEGEAPVNPYSLLEAINRSSTTAHRSCLLFIAAMGYLLVILAGVTHADLLLSRPITLPLLHTGIAPPRFFMFAPVVLVLIHLGVLAQLVLLARKTLAFDVAMRMLEVTDRRTHPLRLELHAFFPVQAIAGPERGLPMGAVLHAMPWLTLVLLPVALLLYLQVVFLPYHDAGITGLHRAALMADVVVLILIGVFLLRPEISFLRAAGSTIRRHPAGLLMASVGLGLVVAFSFLVATVPGEPLDRAALALSRPGADDASGAAVRSGFVVPFLGPGVNVALFDRNLDVTDVDLATDGNAKARDRSIVLRGRDLRFARLDRASLRGVDLTGADLEGASLVEADLNGARLACADVDALAATKDRQAAGCPNARGANFARARLQGAHMAGIDLSGARLDEADLNAADLRAAVLVGASLRGARLERARLTGGISAQGADFTRASLRGADLTGARLAGADFTGAALQGAAMMQAALLGASLRDADLEAVDLRRTQLHGASLRGARVPAADLRGAMLWMTAAPDGASAQLADFSQLVLAPLEQKQLAALDRVLAGIGSERRARIREALGPLLTADARRPWTDDADRQSWQALGAASAADTTNNYKARLTDHLVHLACKPLWESGAVATGVARRALAPEFKGDTALLYDRLRAGDCPASTTIAPDVLRSLAAAADTARGN